MDVNSGFTLEGIAPGYSESRIAALGWVKIKAGKEDGYAANMAVYESGNSLAIVENGVVDEVCGHVLRNLNGIVLQTNSKVGPCRSEIAERLGVPILEETVARFKENPPGKLVYPSWGLSLFFDDGHLTLISLSAVGIPG